MTFLKNYGKSVQTFTISSLLLISLHFSYLFTSLFATSYQQKCIVPQHRKYHMWIFFLVLHVYGWKTSSGWMAYVSLGNFSVNTSRALSLFRTYYMYLLHTTHLLIVTIKGCASASYGITSGILFFRYALLITHPRKQMMMIHFLWGSLWKRRMWNVISATKEINNDK